MPATSPSAPSNGADTKLKSVLVKRADLGGTYKATRDTQPDDQAGHAALVACAGGKNTSADQSAEVKSDDFTSGGTVISSKVVQFATQDSIAADKSLFKRRKISTCYAALAKAEFASVLPSGATIDAVSITVTAGPHGGPKNVAGRVTGHVAVTTSGQHVTIYLESVVITGPKIEAQINFQRQNEPSSTELVSRLTKLVAARAAKA